jgi:hypothetical protein
VLEQAIESHLGVIDDLGSGLEMLRDAGLDLRICRAHP